MQSILIETCSLFDRFNPDYRRQAASQFGFSVRFAGYASCELEGIK